MLDVPRLARTVVAGLAFARCIGVATVVARQAVRTRRTVDTRWGWIETLAAPEPVLMAALTYLVVVSAQPGGEESFVSSGLAIGGLLLSVVGAAVWIWSFATIPSLSSGHYVLPEQVLVTRGPYARVRHPIYAAVVVLWLSVASAFGSLLVLAVAVLYVLPAYWLYARAEETMMLVHFGAAYREYQRRSGRLVPRIGRGIGEERSRDR